MSRMWDLARRLRATDGFEELIRPKPLRPMRLPNLWAGRLVDALEMVGREGGDQTETLLRAVVALLQENDRLLQLEIDRLTRTPIQVVFDGAALDQLQAAALDQIQTSMTGEWTPFHAMQWGFMAHCRACRRRWMGELTWRQREGDSGLLEALCHECVANLLEVVP